MQHCMVWMYNFTNFLKIFIYIFSYAKKKYKISSRNSVFQICVCLLMHVLISRTKKNVNQLTWQWPYVTQRKLMKLFEGDIKTDILNSTYCLISKEHFDTKMIFISYSYQKLWII